MTLSAWPLSYCTNVHPGTTLAAVLGGLREYTALLRQAVGEPIAAGLWLAQPVIRELKETPGRGLDQLKATLSEANLECYTLNAFPFGDFHSPRVKENVYLPDWTDPRRLEYTLDCARVLANLLPAGREGSISTVPLGFKALVPGFGFSDDCISPLLNVAQHLKQLEQETGKTIRLAIEPEPKCVLETTDETLQFFDRLYAAAQQRSLLTAARKFLGVCYDVCHQSVEFESVTRSIQQLQQADVRINKVHITCALQLDDPANNVDGRQALARYVEQRYLHQTFAQRANGQILSQIDLTAELAQSPPEEWRTASRWRIHFHVPVNAEQLGPLSTTRADLIEALRAVKELPYAPHLEVETYTWSVFPEAGAAAVAVPLVEGLTHEMQSTRALLRSLA